MKLDEAIETLKDTRAFHLLRKEYDTANAIQLGIEALYRRIVCRSTNCKIFSTPLPGETEEKEDASRGAVQEVKGVEDDNRS